MSFGAVDGVPFQVPGPAGEVDVAVRDLPGPGGAGPGVIEAAVAAEAAVLFDLGRGPLFRFSVLRAGPGDDVLVVSIHHIVVDGWSLGLICRQIAMAYGNLLVGEPAGLAAGPRFLEWAERQRAELGEAVLDKQVAFWAARLAGLPVLEMPADRPRPAVRSLRGGRVALALGGQVVTGLRALAARAGVPFFAALVAGVQVVLCRYTGQDDLPLGVTMFGRQEPEWEGIVGLLVNMVVLRGDLAGNPSLEEVVERAGESLFEAFEYGQAPFGKVVEAIAPVRDQGRNPLFQVAVQLLGEQVAGRDLALPGLATEPVQGVVSGSQFDMTVNFVEFSGALRVEIEYSADLFDRWRVEAMAGHIERVLAGMAGDPRQPVWEVALLTGPERAAIVALGRGGDSARSGEPVHAVVARIAAAQPSLLAATCRGRELTYGELDARAAAVARYLRSLGIGPEQIVAIALDRDLDFLVALLGVLKAGAAYTVLDPAQPASRLAYILADTAARAVLTREALAAAVPAAAGAAVVCLDTGWDAIEAAPGPLPEQATGDSLIYVLYTSGSTGKPKGVLLEHRALMSFAESYQRDCGLGPGQRMLQLRPLTFDMTHGEIIAALTCGAALVLVPGDLVTEPDALAALIADQQVTYVGMPAALLALVDAGPYPAVTSVMNGGETIPGDLVNKWNLPGRRFINVYGPTEAAVVCAAHRCQHATWHSPPPIGTPYLDRQLYVIDRAHNLVPVGITGELLVGGPEGLARGYLNQPALTAAAFTPDPLCPGARVYHTGDLARWDQHGQLEFLGRRDTQVKLRGHRIELGEIEAALTTHPAVAMAAVTLHPAPHGDQQLAAYTTTTSGYHPATPAQLRQHAATQLPAYMIPATWHTLPQFPLTTTGKIDRTALSAPSSTHHHATTAPRTLLEILLTDMYARLLDLSQVGIDDGFFDLGGSSLQAMRLIARLRSELAVDTGVAAVFLAPTPRQLAVVLRDEHGIDDGLVEEEDGRAGGLDGLLGEEAAGHPATRVQVQDGPGK